MTVQLLWDEAVGRLRSRVSSQNYDMWLRPIELRSFDGSTLRLRAPNSYVRLWFESNFLTTLLKEIHELGQGEFRVEFDPDREDRPALPELVDIPASSSPRVEVIAPPPPPPSAPVTKSSSEDEIVAPEAAS